MLYLEREQLDVYIANNIDTSWRYRDFVQDIKDYIKSSVPRVLLISGLRGVGKTTGLLQSIKGVDAAYITAQLDEDETAEDYRIKLKQCDAHTIVLDEYSWVKGRETLDGLLYTLVQNGKRVIITGTESITLNYLKYGNLIHRLIIEHVTYFSYHEYCRLNNKALTLKSCEEYLEKGGLFEDYIVTNYNSMLDYIKTAIIDNLVAYCKGSLSKDVISIIVYSILYKAVCDSVIEYAPIYKGNYLSLVDFLELANVNPNYPIEASDFDEISSILESVGVLVKVQNYRLKKEYRTYIVNPSLTYQLIKCIYKLDVVDRHFLGYIYESSCMCYLYFDKPSEHTVYYAKGRRGGNDFEIDILIIDESYSHNRPAWVFECKLSNNTVLPETASIVNDTIDNLLADNDIISRFVLYNGDYKVETINGRNITYTNLFNNFDYMSNVVIDSSIYEMIPEATRHLYGNTKEEIVTNYLKEHKDMFQ